MKLTDEELTQVGLNLADADVNRLMYEVLARPDAAAALEYVLDYPVEGPFCGRCRTRHWVCSEELAAMGVGPVNAENCGDPDA